MIVEFVVDEMLVVINVTALRWNRDALVVVCADHRVVVEDLTRRGKEVDVSEVGGNHNTSPAFSSFAMDSDGVP